MEEQKSYFAIIPANIRYDKNIRDKAKLLYSEITALCNEKGYCWATNEYFANLYGVSKTTISILIKQLIDNGYLYSEIKYKEGTKEILNRYLSIVKYPIEEKLNRGIKEKLKDNNIILFNNTINNTYYKEIIEYLNNKLKSNYKYTTTKTQSLIKARINEGFEIEDFKKVIDNKYEDWFGTDMEKFLRPETLFGNKFESYLNQKNIKKEPEWFKKEIKKGEINEQDKQILDEMLKEFG